MPHVSPEKLKQLDYLIRKGQAKTPKLLSERAGMSERTMYDYLKQMKGLGAPIAFTRSIGYHYTEDVVFKFGFERA